VEAKLGTEVEPLIFRCRLTEADAVDIVRCHDLLTVRRSIRRIVVGFATSLAAISLGAIIVRRYLSLETPLSAQVVAIVVLIGWAYLLCGLPLERAWQARWSYRRRAADYLETQVTLSLDGLIVANEAGRSEFQWRLVTLIAETRAGMLFCNSTRQPLFWLPTRLFVGNQLRGQVLTLAESNGVPVHRLT
jgi:hypothetical protein